MDYPVIFPLRERLARRSTDDVRRALQQNRFTTVSAWRSDQLRNRNFRGYSEIWYKLAGRGYAVVRIDEQGHAALTDSNGASFAIGGISPGPHGGRPHYHKEWIQAELFQQYCTGFVRQVVRYDDEGQPVTAAMTDATAKTTHIPR